MIGNRKSLKHPDFEPAAPRELLDQIIPRTGMSKTDIAQMLARLAFDEIYEEALLEPPRERAHVALRLRFRRFGRAAAGGRQAAYPGQHGNARSITSDVIAQRAAHDYLCTSALRWRREYPVNVDGGESLGDLLRDWRALRGKSQLDLSLDAAISQRHLSFIESRRSTPTRAKLMDIAEALDVPLRERNTLLLAAGYAPIYPDAEWDAPQMRSIAAAVARLLKQQEPYPAVLMDRYWNVQDANEAAPRFFGRFIDIAARPEPRNILHLMFDPAGMRPFIRDWERVAASLLDRVRREAVGRVVDARSRALLDALLAYGGSRGGSARASAPADLPTVPIGFEKDGVQLNYFSMISTVGTPTVIAAQELRIECMFPADEETERRHLGFMEAT